jgi:hypothetical protein
MHFSYLESVLFEFSAFGLLEISWYCTYSCIPLFCCNSSTLEHNKGNPHDVRP